MNRKKVPFQRDRVKLSVRALYDMQKLRIGFQLRQERLVRENIMTKEEADKFYSIPLENLEAAEKEMERQLIRECSEHPIFQFLTTRIRGVGPRIAGILVANIDPISRFDTVSKLWSYCGLGLKDGKIQRRVKGVKLNSNEELKMTLVKKFAESIIVQGDKSPYRRMYDDYKNRIINRELNKGSIIWTADGFIPNTVHHVSPDIKRPENPEWTLKHIDNMAKRYIAKQFISDLYNHWRVIEGLTVRVPYPIEYLGHSSVRTAFEYNGEGAIGK